MNNEETKELTPSQIVAELDKYIVGQEKAKRAVAIALRNRYRRSKIEGDMKQEIYPKNILMIGPTGVGKTEIARRLANLVNAPFIKVEATKYTEVGYVGRDVESMIRDLTQEAVRMVKEKKRAEVLEKAERLAVERIIDIMQPLPKAHRKGSPTEAQSTDEEEIRSQSERIRQRLRKQIINNEINDWNIEIEIQNAGPKMIEIFAGAGMEEVGINIHEMIENMIPKRKKKKRVTIGEAKRILMEQEVQRLIDMEAVTDEAISLVEQSGIVFIDELDKIAGRERGSGPDVSREGVQRDILPIIEGSTVLTKYGPVKTNFILFIAAGAFHISKPSDLIPELQGRLPIRVELDSLTKEDFKSIITKPKNALVKQYTALLSADGVTLDFTPDAIDAIAEIACKINEQTENIGARRLYTVMEKLLEDISFNAPDKVEPFVTIDAKYVYSKLQEIIKDEDLTRYIL